MQPVVPDWLLRIRRFRLVGRLPGGLPAAFVFLPAVLFDGFLLFGGRGIGCFSFAFST